ncbi:MAG: TrkA family potassium uptake protein [Planctomycetes bacterium]|nr:TrkA family potassium uptake protein [Planctomycetota bacterium]
MHRVAVVGLGRFGMSVVEQLAASGVQVIAIDSDRELVDEVKDHVDIAVALDSTDERALRSQDIHKVDVLIVAIGENFEAALLTAVIGKKQFKIPRVICRAGSTMHAEIFHQIGVDEVIQPESVTGRQLARKLANPFLEDFIDLGEGFTLIELHAPSSFRGQTLRDLNLRVKYGVNLVAIRRTTRSMGADGIEETRESLAVPQPDEIIQADDTLLLIGSNENLSRLPKE